MFSIVTKEKQKEFEKQCLEKGIGSNERECGIPCICGYYGRACRHMNEKANTRLCDGCALSKFSK